MAYSLGMRLRVPRPKTFLGLISLQAGTELVSLALLLNKAIGIYGVLTAVTGYSLSALQWSMYIYSVLVALSLTYLIRHIRKQSPTENLALAWLYLVDTGVNTAYTTAFAVKWYLVTFNGDKAAVGAGTGPQDAEAARRDEDFIPQSGAPDLPTSIVLAATFTLVRIYFTFVVMSYARLVLRWYADSSLPETELPVNSMNASPFAVGAPLGKGFRGKLGRAMVAVGKQYWLGQSKEDEWATAASAKFRRPAKQARSSSSVAGPSHR